LEYEKDEPVEQGLTTLRSARWLEDGRIAVFFDRPPELPDPVLLAWGDGGSSVRLDEDLRTVESLDDADPPPFLVRVVDAHGTPLSTLVPVDDPAALEDALYGAKGQRDSRPTELQGLEDAPLIQIALWANDKFIFDPDDTPAFRKAQDAAGEEEDAEDTSDFWERYAREELQYDPRSQSYKPLTPGSGEMSPVDELMRELQIMLDSAPSDVRRLRILRGGDRDEEGERGPGTPWTMEARHRRRAYNLFMRWCSAVADPRHLLLDPTAPATNYSTLLGVIFAAWSQDALPPKQCRTLLLTLLTAFVGGSEKTGFLGRIGESEREQALARLDPFVLELGSGLATVALESNWRTDIYDWQPVLQRAIDLDVILPGDWSVRIVERISGKRMNVGQVQDLFKERIAFVDDDTWCQRVAAELGLERITLDLHRQATVRSAVKVDGAGDPLRDVRLLSVARRFLDFKKLPAVAIMSGAGSVMIFEPGVSARAMVAGEPGRTSPVPVSLERLREIEEQGGTWGDLIGSTESEAA
jgi:hypothetical protein